MEQVLNLKPIPPWKAVQYFQEIIIERNLPLEIGCISPPKIPNSVRQVVFGHSIRDVLDCVEDLVEGLTSYLNRDQLQKRKQTTNPDENLALEVSQKFHRSFLVSIFLFNVNSRLEEYLCIQN